MALTAHRPWPILVGLLLGYVALLGVQLGLPLDLANGPAKRFTTPIQPPGITFAVIWGTIFCLQGLGVAAAFVAPAATGPFVKSVWWLWLLGWLSEDGWSITQYLMFEKRAGAEPVYGFWIALALLAAGHVIFSLAARRAAHTLQAVLHSCAALDAPHRSRGAVLGAVLFLFPSALNAGWVSLATCLGVLQVALAHGVTFDDLVVPGIALASVAAATITLQPWLLPRRPATRPARDASSINHMLESGGVQHTGMRKPSAASWVRALAAVLIGAAGYAAAIAWGLGNLASPGSKRPHKVRTAALVLAAATPGLVALGVAVKAWLAVPAVAVDDEDDNNYERGSAASSAGGAIVKSGALLDGKA